MSNTQKEKSAPVRALTLKTPFNRGVSRPVQREAQPRTATSGLSSLKSTIPLKVDDRKVEEELLFFSEDIKSFSKKIDEKKEDDTALRRDESQARRLKRALERGELARSADWKSRELAKLALLDRMERQAEIEASRKKLGRELDKHWREVRRKVLERGDHPLLAPLYGQLERLARLAPSEFDTYKDKPMVTSVSKKYVPPRPTSRSFADVMNGRLKSPLPTPQGPAVGNLDDLENFFSIFGRTKYGKDHDPRPAGRAIITAWLAGNDDPYYAKVFWEYCGKRFSHTPRGSEFIPQAVSSLPDLVKLRDFALQGQNQSAPVRQSKEGAIRVDVDVPVLGLQTLDIPAPPVSEVLRAYLPPGLLDVEKFKVIGSMIALCYAMSQAPSWTMFMTQFGAFLGNHVEHFPRFYRELVSCFSAASQGAGFSLPSASGSPGRDHDADAVRTVIQPLLEATDLDWKSSLGFMSQSFDVAMNSIVARAVFDLVGMMSISTIAASSGILGDPAVALHFLGEVKKHLRKDVTVDTFSGTCFRVVKEFGVRAKQCIQEGSLKPFFETNRTPEQLRHYVSVLLYNEEILLGSLQLKETFQEQARKGAYPGDIFCQMTVHERDSRLLAVKQDVVLQYKVACSSDRLKVTAPEWSRLLGQIEQTVAKRAGQEAAAKQRVQPFGLFLWGPPGTGKTTFMNRYVKVMANAWNYPTESQAVGTLQTDVNFQDTLYSHTWFIKCDDPGLTRTKPVAGVPTFSKMLCNVINREAYEFEKSDLTKKGSAFCSSKAVGVTNNKAGINADLELTEPDAIWRRLKIRIRMEARKECAYPGGTALDPDRCADFRDPDVNVFYVERYYSGASSTISEGDHYPYIPVPGLYPTTDSKAVLSFLRDETMRHIEREERYLVNAIAGSLCESCLHFHVGPCFGGDPDLSPLEEVDLVSLPSLEGDDGGIAHFELESAQSQVRKGEIIGGAVALGAGILTEPVTALVSGGGFAGMRKNSDGSYYEGWMIDQLVKVCANCLMLGGAITILHGILADQFEAPVVQAGSDPTFAVPFAHSSPSAFARFSKEDVPFTSSNKARCSTLDSLERTLQRSVLRVATLDPPRSMWCFLVTGDTIMFPRHLLLDDPAPELCRSTPPVARRILVTPPEGHTVWHIDLDFSANGNAWVLPDRDMVMVAIQKVPWKHMDMTPYLISSDVSRMSMFDEVRFLRPGAPVAVQAPKMGYMQAMSTSVRGHQAYYPVETFEGECGLPVIARYGATVFIAGLHVGTGRTGDRQVGYAEFIPSAVVMAGLGRLSSKREYRQFKAAIPSCFLSKVEGVTLDLPPKSSALLAASRAQGPIYVECTLLNQINGSTLKSAVEPLPSCGADVKLKAILGYGPQDFGPPPFKGNMVNGEWHDSYTRFFGQVSASVVDRDVLEEAYELYCLGMEDLNGIGQVRVLTMYEAIRGVLGTGIRSVNRATSSGAPDFVKKKNLIVFEDESQSILVDQRLVDQIREVESVLADGVIPIPLATLGLKDEVLDAAKISKSKVRIFTILPTAFQVVLKMRLRPLCDLFRSNRDFFESYVGFNAADVDEVSAFITRMKTGDRIDDADYSFYDVRQAWEVAEVQARFWKRLSATAGYSDKEQREVYLLCLSLFFIVRLVKRELVSIVGINPSGSDMTTEWNSVNNSIVIRYGVCAVRKRKQIPAPPVRDWFRSLFTLATFGDDLDSSSSCSWCDFSEIAQEVASLGSILTPGTKEGSFRPLKMDELVFLKRKPVFCPDIGAPTLALSRKSIAKMLFWRMRGELSIPDHHATAITGAAREAFYHGKSFYIEFRAILLEAAGQLALLDNKHCRIPTFESLRDDYLNRRDIQWGLTDEVEIQSLHWELHDEGDVVQATHSPPLPEPLFAGKAAISDIRIQMSEPIQEIVGSRASPMAEVGPLSAVEKVVEKVDDSGVPTDTHILATDDYKEDDVLERPFVLGSGILTAASTQGSFVTYSDLFDRWKTQLASGNLAKTYSGARMDFEVWVTISSPATTGGYAVLSALPYGGNSYAERGFQEDLGFLHSFVFFSTKPEGKLYLPFFYPSGFVDDPGEDIWHVKLAVHSPPISDSDASPLVHFTVWARAVKAQLFNPKLQSSGEVKWSQVAAKLATLPLPMTARAGLSAVSMAAGAMGYTRANEEPEPNVVVRRMTTNTARVDGPDSSDIVAFLPSAALSDEPGIIPGTDGKELEFDTLCGRHSWIGGFSLKPTDTPSTIKAWIPVTPFLVTGNNVNINEFRITPMGAALLPFSAWRGSIEFTFICAFSALQRATIQVFWVPQWEGEAGPTKLSISTFGTNSLYSATFELRAGSCHNFRVGWRSNQAFERSVVQVPLFGDDVATDGLVPSACNGVLYVRVVNDIAGATTSEGAVQVYARGLPGMRPMPAVTQTITRALPGSNEIAPVPMYLSNMRLQVGVFDLGCDEESYDVPSVSSVSPEVTASEKIESARALMQRFNFVAYSASSASTATSLSVGPIGAAHPMIVGPTLSTFQFSFLRWYRSLFSAIRGSLRYRIMTYDQTRLFAQADVAGSPVAFADQSWARGSAGGGTVQCLVGGENALEFLFPMKSYFLYEYVGQSASVRPRGMVNLEALPGLPSLYHYLAAGPDFQVGGYLGGLLVSGT